MTAVATNIINGFSAEVSIKLPSVKFSKKLHKNMGIICGKCLDATVFFTCEDFLLHTLVNHQTNCSFQCKLCSKKLALSKLVEHSGAHVELLARKNSEERKVNKSRRKSLPEIERNHLGQETSPSVGEMSPCLTFPKPEVTPYSSHVDRSDSGVDCQVTIKTERMESDPEEKNRTLKEFEAVEKPSKNIDKSIVEKCAKLFECDQCHREFTQKSGLIIHYMVHTEKRPNVCSECGKRFSLRNGLTRHSLIHKGEKRHKCAICGKSFMQSSHLKTHAIVHLSGEARQSKPRPKKEKQLRFKCNACPMAFSYKSTLDKHLRTHTGEKPFKCPHCDRFFAQKELLSMHEANIHSENKKYECSVCQKQFGVKSGLHGHMGIHTGHKPHLCCECGKSFRKLSHLTQHKRLHTGEKPYLCTLCGKTFSQQAHLKTHFKSHAGEKMDGIISRAT